VKTDAQVPVTPPMDVTSNRLAPVMTPTATRAKLGIRTNALMLISVVSLYISVTDDEYRRDDGSHPS
jgi:hypothetical protein